MKPPRIVKYYIREETGDEWKHFVKTSNGVAKQMYVCGDGCDEDHNKWIKISEPDRKHFNNSICKSLYLTRPIESEYKEIPYEEFVLELI